MTRLPDERDVELAVTTWMREEDEHPADRNRQVGRIMGRIDETPQRRRAWSLLPFRRGSVAVDEADEQLVSASTSISPSLVAVAAVIALLATSLVFLALVPPRQPTAPAALRSFPAAATSVDELVDLNLRAWNGEPELLSEVYAPDGVHTATFYDRTNVYTGPAEIGTVAGSATIEPIGPRIDIPAADGEWRWAGFGSLGGGTACLFHAVDGMLVRHDCVLPEESTEARLPVGLADATASAAIDDLEARLHDAWGSGTSLETLAELYAPDAVHTARYLNTTRSYTGPEQILRVAGPGSNIKRIGERVDFEAPEGELAWASVADVAGGSVCLFRAVDGMVTRHDCVLPIRG